VKVKITKPKMAEASGTRWDVNWTLRLPPEMCIPYATDFDGDDMSLSPIKDPAATEECCTFSWSYGHMSNVANDMLPFISKLFQEGSQA
jgi:hypothetical protein